ncbi:unnamed protein product [Ixodes pacificus]
MEDVGGSATEDNVCGGARNASRSPQGAKVHLGTTPPEQPQDPLKLRIAARRVAKAQDGSPAGSAAAAADAAGSAAVRLRIKQRKSRRRRRSRSPPGKCSAADGGGKPRCSCMGSRIGKVGCSSSSSSDSESSCSVSDYSTCRTPRKADPCLPRREEPRRTPPLLSPTKLVPANIAEARLRDSADIAKGSEEGAKPSPVGTALTSDGGAVEHPLPYLSVDAPANVSPDSGIQSCGESPQRIAGCQDDAPGFHGDEPHPYKSPCFVLHDDLRPSDKTEPLKSGRSDGEGASCVDSAVQPLRVCASQKVGFSNDPSEQTSLPLDVECKMADAEAAKELPSSPLQCVSTTTAVSPKTLPNIGSSAQDGCNDRTVDDRVDSTKVDDVVLPSPSERLRSKGAEKEVSKDASAVSPPRLRSRKEGEAPCKPAERLSVAKTRVKGASAPLSRSGRASRSAASKTTSRKSGRLECGDSELHQLVQRVQDSICTQFQESMGASSDFEVGADLCGGDCVEKEEARPKDEVTEADEPKAVSKKTEHVSSKTVEEEERKEQKEETKAEEKPVPRKRGRPPRSDKTRRAVKVEATTSRQRRRHASKEDVATSKAATDRKVPPTEPDSKPDVNALESRDHKEPRKSVSTDCRVKSSSRKTEEVSKEANTPHDSLPREDGGDESVDIDALLHECSIEEQTHLLHMYQRKMKKKRFVQQPSRRNRRGGLRKSSSRACRESESCASVDALVEALSSAFISKQTTVPKTDAVPSIFRIVKYLRPKRSSERPLRQSVSMAKTELRKTEKEEAKVAPAKKGKPKKQTQPSPAVPESSPELQTPPSGDRCLPLKKRHCLLSDEKSSTEEKEPKPPNASAERSHGKQTTAASTEVPAKKTSEAAETPCPPRSCETPVLTKAAKKALFPIVPSKPPCPEPKGPKKKKKARGKKQRPHPRTKRMSGNGNDDGSVPASSTSVDEAIESCVQKFADSAKSSEESRSRSRSRSPHAAEEARRSDDSEAVTLVEDDSDPDNPLKKISLLKQKQQKLLKAVERARRSKEKQNEASPAGDDPAQTGKRHRKRKMRNRTGFVKVKRKRVAAQKAPMAAAVAASDYQLDLEEKDSCEDVSMKEDNVAEDVGSVQTDVHQPEVDEKARVASKKPVKGRGRRKGRKKKIVCKPAKKMAIEKKAASPEPVTKASATDAELAKAPDPASDTSPDLAKPAAAVVDTIAEAIEAVVARAKKVASVPSAKGKAKAKVEAIAVAAAKRKEVPQKEVVHPKKKAVKSKEASAPTSTPTSSAAASSDASSTSSAASSASGVAGGSKPPKKKCKLDSTLHKAASPFNGGPPLPENTPVVTVTKPSCGGGAQHGTRRRRRREHQLPKKKYLKAGLYSSSFKEDG